MAVAIAKRSVAATLGNWLRECGFKIVVRYGVGNFGKGFVIECDAVLSPQFVTCCANTAGDRNDDEDASADRAVSSFVQLRSDETSRKWPRQKESVVPVFADESVLTEVSIEPNVTAGYA